MKHHTQSQSTFSFYLIKPYQPFNQTRTSTTHNQTTFSLSFYIYSHISQSYRQHWVASYSTQSNTEFHFGADWSGDNKNNTQQHWYMRARCHGQMHINTRAHTHTWARAHTHTQRGKEKTGVAGEGVTKCAASGPFGTFCHHVVTNRAEVTKRAGSALNLTP